MPRHSSDRLARRLAYHQALHDPVREPRNTLRWLPELRRWQSARLEAQFAQLLSNPRSAPAARFFLTDVYGDHDFSRRDADIARVLPMMRGLLPAGLLDAVTDGIELGALTHAFDLRMAQTLQRIAPRRRKLDGALYAQAYREVGLPRLRGHQIDLIGRVGQGLAQALAMPGISTLLHVSRGPAKVAGFAELQGFLERGFAAFDELGDAEAFIEQIDRNERELLRRLFEGDADPFQQRSS
ncbi:MAG: hypothetical protein WKF61_11880 [Luteimonas sp.]